MSQTTSSDPIAAAIAAAQDAARAKVLSEMSATTTTTTAVTPAATASTAVAPLRPGAPLSMSDMGGTSLSVDSWLGVKEHGLLAGPNKDLVANVIQVEIDLDALSFNYAIKFGNNPVTYYKTYDRVIAASGGSWADAVARAQRADPSAREYPSVDIPMTLLTNAEGQKGVVLAEAGSTAGYSVPTTGWGNFKKFWDQCQREGRSGTVNVELDYEKRTKGSNTWGLIIWKLLPAS